MKHLPFALLPLALASAQPTLADEATLPDVVVTADRTEQSVARAIPAVTVITRAQIDKSPARDIGDLLRTYAGLQVARSGGLGQQTAVFTRGTESNHTLILVDGVPITDGVTGQSFIQNLPLEQIDRIEVVKGPMSSLYGSEAIGGVINIISRRARDNSGSLRLTAGNNGLREAALTQNLATQTSSLAATLEGLNYDGTSLLTGSDVERGYQRRSMTLNGDHRIGNLRLTALIRDTQGRTEYLGESFLGFPALDQDTTQRQKQVGAEWKDAGPYSTRLLLAENTEEIQQNQSTNYVRTQRRMIDWQNNYALQEHTLTAGITYTRQRIDNDNGFGAPYHNTPDTRAVYLQDAWHQGDWSLVAAGRAEHDDRYGNYQTGNLNGSYDLNQQQKLYVSIGTAFHAPDGQDIAAAIAPLDPERSRSIELGTKYSGERDQWELAVFETTIRDLIGYDSAFNVVNIDSARIQGIEGSLRHDFGPATLYGNASYLRPIDRSTGDDLSRRPRRNLTVGLEQTRGAWRSFAEVVARSGSDNSSFDTSQLPGFATVNAGTRYQLNKWVELGLAADNLLDKQYGYAMTAGRTYIAQPRQIKATLTLTY